MLKLLQVCSFMILHSLFTLFNLFFFLVLAMFCLIFFLHFFVILLLLSCKKEHWKVNKTHWQNLFSPVIEKHWKVIVRTDFNLWNSLNEIPELCQCLFRGQITRLATNKNLFRQSGFHGFLNLFQCTAFSFWYDLENKHKS